MNCKNCNAPLEDGSMICPACNTDNTPEPEESAVTQPVQESEQEPQPVLDGAVPAEAAPAPEEPAQDQAAMDAEATDGATGTAENLEPNDEMAQSGQTPSAPRKSSKGGYIALWTVLAAAVVALIFLYATKDGRSFVTPNNKDLAAGGVFSAQTLTEDSEQMTQIVAKVGDQSLNNAQFQIYYWMQFYNFMNSYGSYASYFGLDTTKELSAQPSMQPVDESDSTEDAAMLTWEQYFISSALDSYRQYQALALKAQAENMEIAEEYQSYLDGIDEQLQSAAESVGFATADEYVKASFGQGVTMADYKAYMETYLLAMTYANTLHAIEFTEDDISAYYDANADSYAERGIEKIDQNVINVRHILIKPEQDLDTDGNGEMDGSSEAAWAAAEEKANALYEQWKENPTEENFTALAEENSEDTASSSNGGLCENVYPGQMVEAFDDWCFDPSRAAGDHDVVKTEYGYHLMYFVSTGDYIYWYQTAESDYTAEQYDAAMQAVIDEYPMEVNYYHIAVATLAEVSNQENTEQEADRGGAESSGEVEEAEVEDSQPAEQETEPQAETESAGEPAA